MIVNAGGIVLSRRAFGEYDRLCSIFTEHLGKVPARFVGVNRAKGKMKALSEPGVWGEYRLHLSTRTEFAKAVGGRLIGSFPGWRESLGRTFDALACLEMLDRLTPDHQPSPDPDLDPVGHGGRPGVDAQKPAGVLCDHPDRPEGRDDPFGSGTGGDPVGDRAGGGVDADQLLGAERRDPEGVVGPGGAQRRTRHLDDEVGCGRAGRDPADCVGTGTDRPDRAGLAGRQAHRAVTHLDRLDRGRSHGPRR